MKCIRKGYRTLAISSRKRILVSNARRGIGFAANPTRDSRLALLGGGHDVCEAIEAERA